MAKNKLSKARTWTLRLGVLTAFLGLVVGLLFYAQSISPEARQAAAEGSGERGQSTRSAWDSPQGERPIDTVRRQLIEYSGRSFPVALAQTHQWGQAYPGGIILLDSSVLTDDPDIMAFKYAHEWAHQVLGHLNPHQVDSGASGGEGTVHSLRLGQSQTAIEDEADQWAGAFLARYDYDVDAVADYLRSVPYSPTDTTHSPGDKRAEIVLAASQ